MKSIVIFTCVALVAGLSTAAETNKVRRSRWTPEERAARHERAFLRRLGGGLLRKPGTAKGVFVILNAQKKVASSLLAPVQEALDKQLAVEYAIKDAEGITVANVREKIVAAGGTIGVGLVDDAGLPTLLTAPESRWSIINVAALADKCPDDIALAARVRKEILRALAFTTGCAYTTIADPLMRDVTKPGDVDGLKAEKFGIELQKRFSETAPIYGLKPWTVESYRDACAQGWAPPPTNEYQKAAWDDVFTTPDKPIKIQKKK